MQKSLRKPCKNRLKNWWNFRTDFQLIFYWFLKGFGRHLGFQIDAKINEKMYQKTHRFLEGFFMKNGAKMDARGSPKPSQNTSKKRRAFLIHFVRNRRIFPDGPRGADLQKFVQKINQNFMDVWGVMLMPKCYPEDSQNPTRGIQRMPKAKRRASREAHGSS